MSRVLCSLLALVPVSFASFSVHALTSRADDALIPLFNQYTKLEAEVIEDTIDARITRLGDRVRDRHARESQFKAYDHYLSWYWEYRTVSIEVVDRVAKGGKEIQFNITSLWPLDTPDFRAFYRGQNTVAEYSYNTDCQALDDTHYVATIRSNANERRPLQIGDVMEIEFSPFLVQPPRGRSNYYGTAMVYVVGQGGMVPWEGVGKGLAPHPLPTTAWLGGRTTLPYQYSDEPLERFKQMATNISPVNAQPFMLGRRLHHTDFHNGTHSESGNPAFDEQSGKLGPRFVATSCVACHVNNGRALPPVVGQPMLQSVVKVGRDAFGAPHVNFGMTLQPKSIVGTPEATVHIAGYTQFSGKFADGEPFALSKPDYMFDPETPDYYSVRLTPQLVGLGLLEAVSENTVLAFADPDDADQDGISGRAQFVSDPQTAQLRLGRFGYKASQPKLVHQIAGALNSDMGVTTSIFSELDRGETQPQIRSMIELSDTELDNMYRYIATLGVPARRDLDNAQARVGERLFTTLNCAGCHRIEMGTSPYHPLAELRNQSIQPFTDLLLHDMGAELADSLGEHSASGVEWRTPPLWGIGLTAGVSGGEAYLHDGRARSLTEAILWHGGEAEASKEAFRNLPAPQRASVIAFLKSL